MLFKYIEKIENDGSVLKYFRCINGFHCDICEAAVRSPFQKNSKHLINCTVVSHTYVSIHIR